MPFRTAGTLSRDDLLSVFVRPATAKELVGLEVENAVLDASTGRAAPYHGGRGVEALITRLAADFAGEPVLDAGHLTGFRDSTGLLIALEHGGAVEYAASPAAGLTAAIDGMHETMARISETARSFGLAIVPGAIMPFNDSDSIEWVPKPRGRAMRDFFAEIGDDGADGALAMALTLSTQTTLDYLSEQDLAEKVRMQAAAGPVVAAMFANSPLAGGRITGLQSTRSRWWRKTDPRRCGLLAPALCTDMTPGDLVDWALRVPMMYYRATDGSYRVVNCPFGDVLDNGFADGRQPTGDDWISHLSQVWTDVRVRQTLELRSADGPTYTEIPSVCALWVGLTYHPQSRQAAWALLQDFSADQLCRLIDDLPEHGLRSRLGGVAVEELGRELVRLADAGLAARVGAGIEGTQALRYLDPLKEVLDTGVTFADRTVRRWQDEFRTDPSRYVAALRV
jgi:glutamate--cysteine ligase